MRIGGLTTYSDVGLFVGAVRGAGGLEPRDQRITKRHFALGPEIYDNFPVPQHVWLRSKLIGSPTISINSHSIATNKRQLADN